MTNLLLHEKLRNEKKGEEARRIAQIRTNTSLERLDINRKSRIIEFLGNLGLVNSSNKSKPKINLIGASLKDTLLMVDHLEGAELQIVNLKRADLLKAYLNGAHLEGAHLEGANLEEVNLEDTYLKGAYYDKNTIWPDGFDPVAAGAVFVKEKM